MRCGNFIVFGFFEQEIQTFEVFAPVVLFHLLFSSYFQFRGSSGKKNQMKFYKKSHGITNYINLLRFFCLYSPFSLALFLLIFFQRKGSYPSELYMKQT